MARVHSLLFVLGLAACGQPAPPAGPAAEASAEPAAAPPSPTLDRAAYDRAVGCAVAAVSHPTEMLSVVEAAGGDPTAAFELAPAWTRVAAEMPGASEAQAAADTQTRLEAAEAAKTAGTPLFDQTFLAACWRDKPF